MLDLIPSVFLAGENDGVATSMYKLMKSFEVYAANHSSSLSWAHRHYPGHQHAMLCSLQAVAKELLGSIPLKKSDWLEGDSVGARLAKFHARVVPLCEVCD